MGFKNKNDSVTFCILCIIVFFGISSFMLINDYIRLPHKNPDNTPYMIRSDLRNKLNLVRDYPDYWVINSFDGKITNIENIIIWILMLWGFLRLIDLGRMMLKDYNKQNCTLEYKNE